MARIEVCKTREVGEIRLNRPEVLNAMDRHWPDDMLAAAAAVNDDPAIRVVVVSGAGRSFCSGLDLTELAADQIQPDWFHRTELAFRSVELLDKPVIAAVQGHCIGGGLQLAIACDVRLASDDASFSVPAALEAFIPGMSTWRLPRVIGYACAKHLILSGESVDAAEARRIGLVNRVVPRGDLRAEVDAWAARYAQVPSPSLKWSKRLTNRAFDLPFERFLEEYDKAVEIVLKTEEHEAAREAWRNRRKLR